MKSKGEGFTHFVDSSLTLLFAGTAAKGFQFKEQISAAD